jgi:hypothetical protein
MLRGALLFVIIILSGFLSVCAIAQQAQRDNSKPYDESIFIISNYSGISAAAKEESTLDELVKIVDGFMFRIDYDSGNKILRLRNPDNSYSRLQMH